MKTIHRFGPALLSLLPLLPMVLLDGPMAYAGSARASPTMQSARNAMTPARLPNRRPPPPRATAPVNLASAGNFVILSKSGITNVPTSGIVGVIGTSPITGAADHLTCTEVTGRVYSVDAAGPSPCNIMSPSMLTVAIGDMQTAYTDAAGRTATVNELATGNIGGLTLGPAVYKWSSNVSITSNLTLNGTANSVWIFEIAQNLSLSNGKAVNLTGGAQAKNVFWQVAGQVNLGTTSHFSGVVLSKTLIAMLTGASVNGRLLAQTAVTLQMNSVSIH